MRLCCGETAVEVTTSTEDLLRAAYRMLLFALPLLQGQLLDPTQQNHRREQPLQKGLRFKPAVLVRSPSLGDLAVSANTIPLQQLASIANLGEVAVLEIVGGQKHLRATLFDELCSRFLHGLTFVVEGFPGEELVPIDPLNPPSLASLMLTISTLLTDSDQLRQLGCHRLQELFYQLSGGHKVKLSTNQDVLVLCEDVIAEGRDAILLVGVTTFEPKSQETKNKAAPPPHRFVDGCASLFTPPPTQRCLDEEVERIDNNVDVQSVSIICIFNPPVITVVGDTTAVEVRLLNSCIVDHCIGTAKARLLKRPPTFEDIEVEKKMRVRRLTLPQLYFDDAQQSMLFVVILDVMDSFRRFRFVPVDSITEVESNLIQQSKEKRLMALSKGGKTVSKSSKSFTQTTELLFICRK